MRTIKFRAQDIASNKWLYGDLRHHKDDVCIFEQGGTKGEQVKRDTIGQFIGLLDKNGKEIYEGDIVKVKSLEISTFGKEMKATIVYDDELACYDFLTNDRQRIISRTIPDAEIEVIGNIHDNPQLINK